MGLLDNKVAFITGAASGIGAGMARRLAEEGASVAIADIAQESGQQVCAAIKSAGRRAICLECDVSDPASVENAIGRTVEQFGKLDIVVANAGINGVWAPVEEIQPEEWDRTQAVNLKGTFLTVHYAVPHLKQNGGGSIVITSSVNGTRNFGLAGASAYSSSKAGQVAFMKMMAVELGRYNIRCNAICPGLIETNIDQSTTRRGLDRITIKVELPDGLPVLNKGRAQPAEIADVCLFLASDLSRHMSGVELYVDGGASLL